MTKTKAAKRTTPTIPYSNRHDAARTHTLRPGRVYVCIGPNVWGKAFTPQQAEQNAREEYRGAGHMPFVMMDAPPDTYIDGMGGTVYTPCLYQTQDQIDALRDPRRTPRTGDPDPKTIADAPRRIYSWGIKEEGI